MDSLVLTVQRPAVTISPVGGSVINGWTQLRTVEQAASAISDPGGFAGAGTGFDGDLFTYVPIGDTTQILGYQHNWPGWSQRVVDLYPDFDPDTDLLQVAVQVAAMPLTTAKYGWWAGVVDAPITTRGTLNGGGVHVFPNSATATNGGIMGATALGSNNQLATTSVAVTEIRGTLEWVSGATYPTRTTGQCSRASGGDADVPSAGAIGASLGGDPSTWRICVGAVHVAAVSGTPALACRVWHRRIRTSGHAVPILQPGLRPPLGGPVVVAVIGHSIANGYAATGADTTIPAGVTCVDEGVAQATWPSGSPNPNRALMHTLSTALLAAGYTSVALYRRSTPSITLATMMSSRWTALVGDLAVAGVRPDLIVVEIGENDAQAGEGAAFAARFAGDLAVMRAHWPEARILVADPPTTDLGGYPEIATVTAGIVAAISAAPARGLIPDTGVSLADTVHPDAAGADVQGTAAGTAYLLL